MPRRFILESQTDDGGWMDWGAYRRRLFDHKPDGSYSVAPTSGWCRSGRSLASDAAGRANRSPSPREPFPWIPRYLRTLGYRTSRQNPQERPGKFRASLSVPCVPIVPVRGRSGRIGRSGRSLHLRQIDHQAAVAERMDGNACPPPRTARSSSLSRAKLTAAMSAIAGLLAASRGTPETDPGLPAPV
jgi:hypothetical protein